MDRQAVGARIEELARALGGKRALANALGISETQIYRYIAGKNSPGADILDAISQLGGVSPAWIMYGVEDEPETLETLDTPHSPERTRQAQIVSTLQSRIEGLLAEGDLTDPNTLYQLAELTKTLETALRALNQLNP